ncbi:MAG: rhodanese-like domain-containing protein [bacterium]
MKRLSTEGFMKKAVRQVFFICLAGMAAGFSINAASRNPLPFWRIPVNQAEKWPVLDADEVMRRIDEGSAIVLDAREAKEYQLGHLPGAINLPVTDFDAVYGEIGESLPRDYPIIVYCQGGPCEESHQLLDLLSLREFQDLYLYPGGWLEWKERGLPVETSDTEQTSGPR